MKIYAPIGYYNDPEDIIDLFPNSAFKGDEADIVVNYLKDGYGNFHSIDCPDIDNCISPKDASEDKCTVFTSDGQYIVRFSLGDYNLLRKKNDMHGFFIDIYKLTEDTDCDEHMEESEEEKEYAENSDGITEMNDDELQEYALDLVTKTNGAIAELIRRKLL
jgi:hypothetical protein